MASRMGKDIKKQLISVYGSSAIWKMAQKTECKDCQELHDIFFPSQPDTKSHQTNEKHDGNSIPSDGNGRRPSTLQKTLVIGACVATSAVIGGLLIPFVSPGFRRIALPYVPATDRQVRLVTSVLKRKPAGSRMVDLGSGDGRLVIAGAKEGLSATGVEMNWWLVLWSRWRSYVLGVSPRTKFIRQDLYKCDLRDYDVIVLFGVSGMMEAIKKKLTTEMKPSCLFVACRFPLPNAHPAEQLGAGIDTVWVYEKTDVTAKNNAITKK